MNFLYIASQRLVIRPPEQRKFGIKDVVNTLVTEDELPVYDPEMQNKNILALYYSNEGELCIGEMTGIKDKPGLYNLTITVFTDETLCRLFILQKVPEWKALIRYMMN